LLFYDAPPGALPLGVPTKFFNPLFWGVKDDPPEDQLGVIPSSVEWHNGKAPPWCKNYQGDKTAQNCIKEHPDLWLNGIVTTNGYSYDAAGGVACCTQSDECWPCCSVSTCPCDNYALMTPIADPVGWGDACFYLGPTMDLSYTPPCTWHGTWYTWSGNFSTTFTNQDNMWTWTTETSPPVSFTAVGDMCPPVTFSFTIPDIDTQPFATGIPCSGEVVLPFYFENPP
jgi:hypothetical protein